MTHAFVYGTFRPNETDSTQGLAAWAFVMANESNDTANSPKYIIDGMSAGRFQAQNAQEGIQHAFRMASKMADDGILAIHTDDAALRDQIQDAIQKTPVHISDYLNDVVQITLADRDSDESNNGRAMMALAKFHAEGMLSQMEPVAVEFDMDKLTGKAVD